MSTTTPKPNRTRHPLVNIAEWRKGCGNTQGQGKPPSACVECTTALVRAIENWFNESVRSEPVRALADRIAEAVAADEASEGCDLSAGMFGLAMSTLVVELAQQEAELYAVQDQVAELQRMMESSDKALANAQKGITARDELLVLIQDCLLTQTEVEQRIKRLHCKHETWLGHSGTGRIFCADCGAPHE